MGRPLKIKKYATPAPAQGDTDTFPGAAVYVDQGFNPWSALTAPVIPEGFTPGSTTEYGGVVGGANNLNGTAVATAAYPVVKCRVYITGSGAEDDGYIITQKGTTKYLVAANTSINDESMVVGKSYQIRTVGSTNWQACGAPSGVRAGDVFTCTKAGSGTGTVRLVGQCVLADEADGALTEGNMNITFSFGDSTATNIKKLTNKFALDYSDNRYAVNFFTDEGTEIKSGTRGDTLNLAIVENYTS